MQCTACGGSGCDECQDGYVRVATCPKEWIGTEIWRTMLFSDLYQKGNPPVAGGALDQTNWFLQFCMLAWSEEAYWKAKLGVIG